VLNTKLNQPAGRKLIKESLHKKKQGIKPRVNINNFRYMINSNSPTKLDIAHDSYIYIYIYLSSAAKKQVTKNKLKNHVFALQGIA
jgi:hypothetical protein